MSNLQKESPIIIGVWDCAKARGSLGSFIIFQEELRLFKQINIASTIDVYVLSSNAHPYISCFETICQFNPDIRTTFLNDDFSWQLNSPKEGILCWPPQGSIEKYSYNESTLGVQELWGYAGILKNLIPPANIQKIALEWINCFAAGKRIITVHLKNSLNDSKSNANQKNWTEFFGFCAHAYPLLSFVLIGNDQLKPDILECENVISTHKNGGNLALDLSLISCSLIFMGMASGPCNFSLMSDRPYLIWKHPGHHTEEMKREFCGHPQFVFANRNQKFLIDWDTPMNLINEFEKLYSQVN